MTRMIKEISENQTDDITLLSIITGFQNEKKDLANLVFKVDKKMFSTQNLTNIAKDSVTG